MSRPRSAVIRERLDDMDSAGFTLGQIAEAAGLTPAVVDLLYDYPVTASHAEALAITAAHRELCPDIDEVVVERFIAGDPPDGYRPNVPERRKIVHLLALDRVSHGEIAERAHTTIKTVDRILDRLGLTEHRAPVS